MLKPGDTAWVSQPLPYNVRLVILTCCSKLSQAVQVLVPVLQSLSFIWWGKGGGLLAGWLGRSALAGEPVGFNSRSGGNLLTPTPDPPLPLPTHQLPPMSGPSGVKRDGERVFRRCVHVLRTPG